MSFHHFALPFLAVLDKMTKKKINVFFFLHFDEKMQLLCDVTVKYAYREIVRTIQNR